MPSIVCPNCRTLIHVDETRCPNCGTYRPGLWGFGNALSRLFGGRIDVLSLIPTACVALYVLSLVLDLGAALNTRGGMFGMLSPGNRPLVALGMTANAPGYYQAPLYTLLTATYLHGGLLHIVFNVLWIRQLGPEVGGLYGPARYFIIFTCGGVAGFALSNAMSGAPTVGASAAIFGLFAALIVYGRSRGGMAAMMTRQVWQWAILLFMFGFMMRNVNNWAHLGGFIGGWISSRALVGSSDYKEGRGTLLAALALLLLTGAAFVLSLFDHWTILLK